MNFGTKKKPPVAPTRYDCDELNKRFERERLKREVNIKDLCDWPTLKWERSHYSRKIRNDQTNVSIHEWGHLCDALERLSGEEVPAGFPFLPIEMARMFASPKRGTNSK
jgi:hypothetical protein